MLLSILKGWSMKRPIIRLDETTSIRDWKLMKNEVKEWINFYQNISVSSIQEFGRYGGSSNSNRVKSSLTPLIFGLKIPRSV